MPYLVSKEGVRKIERTSKPKLSPKNLRIVTTKVDGKPTKFYYSYYGLYFYFKKAGKWYKLELIDFLFEGLPKSGFRFINSLKELGGLKK